MRNDSRTDAPSITATGTQSPTSASQSTLASANHGNTSAPGRNTAVPTMSATSQERSGVGRRAPRCAAYAKASAKIGAATTRMSETATLERSIVIWFTVETTIPRGSAATNREP